MIRHHEAETPASPTTHHSSHMGAIPGEVPQETSTAGHQVKFSRAAPEDEELCATPAAKEPRAAPRYRTLGTALRDKKLHAKLEGQRNSNSN